MNNGIITVEELAYCYSDGTRALTEVSFRVANGESVAVIGENGAGKSTLLLHLNGSLKPSSGRIEVAGLELNKKNLNSIRSRVGMVFQNPDDQLFMPTVYDDVAFGPLNMGLTGDEVIKCVESALAKVGLLQLKEKAPFRLSGGEKKKIAIATVLSMSPDILVFDEPAANLDPRGRRSLITLLKNLGQTRIIASHDLDLVLELCKRTIVLHQGRIVADGKTSDLLADRELLERCSLELPLSMQGCPVCSGKRIQDFFSTAL